MHREQPEPKGLTFIEDSKKAANLLVLIAQVLAAPVEVVLRKRFGRRYFGIPSAIAIFAIPMWMLFWPSEDPTPIFVFWLLYIVMQLRARIESIAMVSRGDIVHTRFNGVPRLASILKRTSDDRLKQGIEPMLVMGIGVACLTFSAPLGSYLIAAGFSLSCVESLIRSVDRARTLQIHDAWLEQQYQAEQFRRLREPGDHF